MQPTNLPLEPRPSKRIFDFIGSAIGLLLAAPLGLFIALLIRLEDGGPVLFTQDRAGRSGRPFRMFKFRSMVVGAAGLRAQLASDGGDFRFKKRIDPRCTRVGRLLRRLSLDELPQLWNVLRGEMSLVGPRPAILREVAEYRPEAWQRLAVKPGLTCIWQVSGRADLSFAEQLRMDLEYIRRRSIVYDLKLLLRTVPAVLSGHGAY